MEFIAVYPTVSAVWRRVWERVIPFFTLPPAVRKVIYTTNALESVNAGLRKIIRTRGYFPSDEAATKLLWLVLRNIPAGWLESCDESIRDTVRGARHASLRLRYPEIAAR